MREKVYIKISSVLKTLEDINHILSVLKTATDVTFVEDYMTEVDGNLDRIFQKEVVLIEDDEFLSLNNQNRYHRVIKDIRYLGRNGWITPHINTLIMYVEDFLY